LLLLTFGCSTTLPYQRPVSKSSQEQLDEMLRDRDATLTYARSGAEPQKDIASDITVAGDKVQWTRWESEQARSRGSPPGQRVEAPIDAVKNISVCKPGCRGRGALEGAGLGAAAGLLLSAVLVSTAGHSNEGIDFSPFVWTAGPVLGALIGTLIGTRGVPTNIEFQPAPVRQ